MTDKEVVMEHINEITGEISNMVKRSIEQMNESTTKLTNEATKAMETSFGQTREFIELGFKAQQGLWTQWLKSTEASKEMWEDMAQTCTKTYETKAPLKAAK